MGSHIALRASLVWAPAGTGKSRVLYKEGLIDIQDRSGDKSGTVSSQFPWSGYPKNSAIEGMST